LIERRAGQKRDPVFAVLRTQFLLFSKAYSENAMDTVSIRAKYLTCFASQDWARHSHCIAGDLSAENPSGYTLIPAVEIKVRVGLA